MLFTLWDIRDIKVYICITGREDLTVIHFTRLALDGRQIVRYIQTDILLETN